MKARTLGSLFAVTLLCAVLMVAVAAAVAQPRTVVFAQSGPEFQLGFQELAQLIPDVVGEPVEDAHPTANGDVLQLTTTGLMVWRHADNWTGFTDGGRTWINGPSGIAVRSNQERFSWESHPPETFDDPVAYCAAVGTIDQPDDRYTGPPVPDVVREGLARALGVPAAPLPSRGIFFRCFEGRLLACTVGANLNCGKADISDQPTPAMVKFCQANPQADFIPLAVVGHSGIFAWQCRAGTPSIASQTLHVDPRGFVAENWHDVTPEEDKR